MQKVKFEQQQKLLGLGKQLENQSAEAGIKRNSSKAR